MEVFEITLLLWRRKRMRRHVSFEGRTVFLGIDVHREFFVVSALSEGQLIQTCRVPGRFERLYSFITKYFGGAHMKVSAASGT
jgi:hypothetical protein